MPKPKTEWAEMPTKPAQPDDDERTAAVSTAGLAADGDDKVADRTTPRSNEGKGKGKGVKRCIWSIPMMQNEQLRGLDLVHQLGMSVAFCVVWHFEIF